MNIEQLLKQLGAEDADQTALLKQFSDTVKESATAGLSTKNKELLTQVKSLKEVAAQMPEGFDKELWETMLTEHKEKKDAKLVAQEKWDELKTELQNTHKTEQEKLASTIDKLKSALSTQLIDNTATAAITEAGGNAKLLLPHVKAYLSMVEDSNGAYATAIVDGTGNPRHSIVPERAGEPMSINELVAEFQANQLYAPAFAAPNSGGGAGTTGVNGYTGENPFAEKTINYTQQGKLRKSNPDLAAQLEKAAANG